MTELPLSIVIATYNRCNQLPTLLNGLLHQDLPGNAYEITVVDDGSQDNTGRIVEDFKERAWNEKKLLVHNIKQPNAGQAKARDRGVKKSQGKLIVFLDDDMEPFNENLLKSYISMHEEIGEETVLIGKILPPKGDPLRAGFEHWWEKGIGDLYKGFSDGSITPGGQHFFTANIAITRSLYNRVGGFDFSFRHAEDHELGVRIQIKSDASFHFCSTAAAYHNSPVSQFRSFKNRAELYGQYFYQIFRLNGGKQAFNPAQYLVASNPLKNLIADFIVKRTGLALLSSPLLTVIAYTLGVLDRRNLVLPFCSALYLIHFVVGLKKEVNSEQIFELIDHYQTGTDFSQGIEQRGDQKNVG